MAEGSRNPWIWRISVFSEKEEDRCKEVEEVEKEDGSLDRLLLVQSDLASLIHQVTTISLLTIRLFLEKMISKTKDCILLYVFYNVDEKNLLNLSFIRRMQVWSDLRLTLSLSAFVFVWLLGKCGRLYLCFWILKLQSERETYWVHFKL